MNWKVKKEKKMNREDYEKMGLNSFKVEKILNEFISKIPQNLIINVCREFDTINSIVKFDCNIEDIIKEYLNIEVETEEINKQQLQLNHKLRDLKNKSFLLKRNKIDRMRSNGSIDGFLNTLSKIQLNELLSHSLIRGEEMSSIELSRFKEKQREYSTNYNKLETENVSTSNPNIWK